MQWKLQMILTKNTRIPICHTRQEPLALRVRTETSSWTKPAWCPAQLNQMWTERNPSLSSSYSSFNFAQRRPPTHTHTHIRHTHTQTRTQANKAHSTVRLLLRLPAWTRWQKWASACGVRLIFKNDISTCVNLSLHKHTQHPFITKLMYSWYMKADFSRLSVKETDMQEWHENLCWTYYKHKLTARFLWLLMSSCMLWGV